MAGTRTAPAECAPNKAGRAPTAAKTPRSAKPAGAADATVSQPDPVTPPDAPERWRARVRMYRQGLGDCFLLTFPRDQKPPLHILIDCGVLDGTREEMTKIVEHIRETVRDGDNDAGGRLDVVVSTHEHKDHLSGFNQAREVFESLDIRSVWMGWTENLTQPEVRKIKEAKRSALKKLGAAFASPLAAAAENGALSGMASLLRFSEEVPAPPGSTIHDALEYLKFRGNRAGDLRFLKPGEGPLKLDGVEGVRVFVLGPPTDPILLKQSEVTAQAKKDDAVYHLGAAAMAGIDALCAALPDAGIAPGDADRYHPFAIEHRIAETIADPLSPGRSKPNPYYEGIREFVDATYLDDAQKWRRIDDDWLTGMGQLALDLDSDTNNTSLVLAFEFEKTGEVLLFVGDAQVGNWKSWAGVEFTVPGRAEPVSANDLLHRTVFYKVGHHCSHNATAKKGGLELMTRDDLVAFIPLDKDTAARQGKRDPATGKARGWAMPAAPLFKALNERAKNRVVISDRDVPIPQEAIDAGVRATPTYVDYYLE
jgi:hypothetical protein